MKITELLSDDNAVSPVIGVILMVAITVILAAVIGTFVLNLGGSVSQTAPQASFAFDFENGSNDNVTITHETGDSIKAARLNLTASKAVDIATDKSNLGAGGGSAATSRSFVDSDAYGASDTISAGSTLYAGNASDLNGEEFRVVWASETGDSSATLSKWTAPDN